MCAVSSTGDMYRNKFSEPNPWITYPNPPLGQPLPGPYTITLNPITRQEFDELKAIVLQMREDLLAAKKQDIEEGNSDCEMEDKVALLKKVAELVGVSLEDVFGK